jgi:hypothetical protein
VTVYKLVNYNFSVASARGSLRQFDDDGGPFDVAFSALVVLRAGRHIGVCDWGIGMLCAG